MALDWKGFSIAKRRIIFINKTADPTQEMQDKKLPNNKVLLVK